MQQPKTIVTCAEWAARAAGEAYGVKGGGGGGLQPRSPRWYRAPRYLEIYRDSLPPTQAPAIGAPRDARPGWPPKRPKPAKKEGSLRLNLLQKDGMGGF